MQIELVARAGGTISGPARLASMLRSLDGSNLRLIVGSNQQTSALRGARGPARVCKSRADRRGRRHGDAHRHERTGAAADKWAPSSLGPPRWRPGARPALAHSAAALENISLANHRLIDGELLGGGERDSCGSPAPIR
jgi:hypothetical protein